MDDVCAKCGLGITSHGIGPVKELPNAPYFHIDCFECAKCNKAILYNQEDHPFVFQSNKLFHAHCVNHTNILKEERTHGYTTFFPLLWGVVHNSLLLLLL